MKALTLTQPWATLMALQEKRIETRSWPTKYRGEVVIHSSKQFPGWAKDLAASELFQQALGGADPKSLPLSRGLCVVRILGCIPTNKLHGVEIILGHKPPVKEIHFGDYSENRYAWVTEFVRSLDNVGPVKGSLGLWDWAESDQARFENQLVSGKVHL